MVRRPACSERGQGRRTLGGGGGEERETVCTRYKLLRLSADVFVHSLTVRHHHASLPTIGLPERLERERYTYNFQELNPTPPEKASGEAGSAAQEVLPEVLNLISDGR